MGNSDGNKSTDKNKLYIGAFSLIIVIAVIIILVAKSCSNQTPTTNSNASVSANDVKPVSVVSESGDQKATCESNIKVRKINFLKKIDAIKKYEKKQTDTDGEPSVAKSEDGYTYLNYKFNAQNAPTFFGSQVSAADPAAMLVYVFNNDNLIEVRIQYGNIGTDGYNKIASNLNSTYGNSTYSRSYSNGTEESWWKTDKITLDVICQDSSVIAYYRTNK